MSQDVLNFMLTNS